MNYLKIEKAYLCGYSTGSSVILEFLLKYPDRALGAILVGGLSEVHDFRLKARIYLGVILTKLKAIKLLSFALATAHSNSPAFFWHTYQVSRQGNAKNVEQYYSYSLNYNCTGQLQNIDVPVLLIYGEKDKGFHSYGRLLHQCLRRSQLLFVTRTNHRIPIKAQRKLNHLISQFVHVQEPS